jgi:hypothetical protein
MILGIWILLFFIITGSFGKSYGVPYLLLDPEYLGNVNFWSLLILGFAFGIFYIAYNITLYILESYRFPFLMIRRNPFPRFCLNNFFIPLLFVIFYTYFFVDFQKEHGRQPSTEVLIEIFGFLLGILLTIGFSMVYFRVTGYAIFRNMTENLNTTLKSQKITRVNIMEKIKLAKRASYQTDSYLDFPLKVVKVEEFTTFDRKQLTKAIDRNHINALLLQVAGFIFIILLGYFRDNIYFQIPAGASILILVSIIIMVLGLFTF